MSQSAQPDASKRKRLLSPSEELSNNSTMSSSPPPDISRGTARLPSHQTASVDTESLLLEMIQTETGAADLAQALRSRRVRDVLEQHGVKIQTNDDVGYNSLPLELRDNIRRFFIAGAHNDQGLICRCGHCTRLAPYACINSEWRNAVERVTFRQLTLRDWGDWAINDLKLLERYVVGSRRQCLQYICLSLDTDNLPGESSDQDKVDSFTSPILQLFNVLNQWDGCLTAGGDLHLELQTTYFGGPVADSLPLPLDGVHAGLTNLPTAAQVTGFCVSLWEPVDARSMLVLLSRMPNLRSLTIMREAMNLSANGADHFLQAKVFFDSLPQTAPNLESLEIKCVDGLIDDDLHLRFYTEALSYSQRLRECSLVGIEFFQLPAILAPFSTIKFNPYAPPPLIWPNLTDFIIDQPDETPDQDEFCELAEQLLLRMGRAIRYMPRIQNLEMRLSYLSSLQDDDCRFELILEIESPRGSFGHSPMAKLFITYEGDKSVAEDVLSTEVTDLWKESVSKVANAILEVKVTFVENQVEEIEED